MKRVLPILIFSVPLVLHAWAVLKYAVNVPYYDDFEWAIQFLKDFLDVESFKDGVELLFSQHNQHRIVWLRLCVLGIHAVLGYLDFRVLVILGNLQFFAFTGVFLAIFFKSKLPIWYLIPLGFILHGFFSIHNIAVSYGVPNMSVLFFSVWSFYLIFLASKKWFFFGLLIGFLATFTNGNGILTMPLLFLCSLLVFRDFRSYMLLATAISALLLYFFNYQTDYSEIQLSSRTIPYFIEFMTVYFPGYQHALLKIVLVAFFFYLVWKVWESSWERELKVFFLVSVLFLFGAGALATLFRLIHNLHIPDWYAIYSIAFVALLYLAYIKLHPKPVLLPLLFSFACLFFWYNSLQKGLNTQQYLSENLVADLSNFKRNGHFAHLPGRMGEKRHAEWEKNFQELLASGDLKLSKNLIEVKTRGRESDLIEIKESHSYFEISYTPESEKTPKYRKIYGIVRRDNSLYLSGCYHWNQKLSDALFLQSWFSENSLFLLPKTPFVNQFPKGEYKVGFLFCGEGDSQELLWCPERIFLENP